jgi:acyl-coenzyme A synthetase/AMP-(fatty) acid ligase
MLSVEGGTLAPEEIEAGRRLITRNVYVSYACTEVGLIALLRPDDPVGPPGNVGRLVPGLDAQVVDDDDRLLPAGSVGKLGFRAPWIPEEYVGNDAATARSFRDEWFYPGDIGAIDPEGRLSFHGRSDEVINFGGIKLRPEDVEAVLAEHPDIADAAVIGVPHPMAGAMPVALVVPRRGVAQDALTTFCRSRLDAARVPVSFVEVPQIFRSAEGKILRHRLLAEYGGLFSSA